MQVDDKVKITAQGIEYNEGKVTSVNDSTVVIRQGHREVDYFYNTIRIDEIDNLIIAQKDKKKTTTNIVAGSFVAIGVGLLIVFIVEMVKWEKAWN
jgi:hypothetical protein